MVIFTWDSHEILSQQEKASYDSRKNKSAKTVYETSTQSNSSTASKCELCNKFVSRIFNLNRHMKTFHEKQKKIQCHIFNKIFCTKYYLKTHMATIHKKLKLNQCSFCAKRCSFKGNLKKHIDSVH